MRQNQTAGTTIIGQARWKKEERNIVIYERGNRRNESDVSRLCEVHSMSVYVRETRQTHI